MPRFEHASFVTYRHGQGEIKRRFIDQFVEGLGSELELLRNERIFIDRDRLNGGDFYNEALARALYLSATMILIYQPNYFDPQYPYCTREYRAMCTLEQERLSRLNDPVERTHSLIIPVVLRGERDLPAGLRQHRQYEDFTGFTLVERELSRHRDYAPKLRSIAEYVKGRCDALESADVPFDNSSTFTLPDQTDVVQWIERLNLPSARFPTERGIG